MNFVHLHVHSHYSLLDGLAKIDDLIEKAKRNKMPALALTDHGNMYGAIEFYQKCTAAGIKPIVGCEIYIAPRKNTDKDPKIDVKPYHLTLLAKNEKGYKNLLKIVTNAHLYGFYYKPRTDKPFLKEHSQGLIALSGCIVAEIPRLIFLGRMEQAKKAALWHRDCFGKDNFYLEIQPHDIPSQAKVNGGLKQLSKELKIPLVATNDIHYINREDRRAHEVLLAVNTGKRFEEEKRLTMKECDLSMNTPGEMQKIFKDTPEAVKNTSAIAEKIRLKIRFKELILPHFKIPKGTTNFGFLKRKVEKGFKRKYPSPTTEQEKRLKYELGVIKKTGFASYFLIVADFVGWAKRQGIMVGPGRGSAAGSIVSYCLDITAIEPIRYGLLFERFLNPARIAPPDIDLDFADDRRDEVIKYISQKYGKTRVAQIVTFGVMKARSSIRDVTRSLGYPYELGDRIAKQIPFGMTIDQALAANPELQKIQEEEDARRVIEMGKKMEGVVRHASIHAAGIVISRRILSDYTPLQYSPHDKSIITQYPMFDLEAIGLLKIDILGLANLTIMKNACRIIRKIHHKKIDIDDIPLDDKKTFRLLSRGETIGVFQLESDGMRRYIKELQPEQLKDIIAMVALYRPGPMQYIPRYIQSKKGFIQPEYIHPKLEAILKDTYGIAVYQEQVLQIARDIAGFSYGEADVLRKAVGKKDRKLLNQQKKKFIKKAIERGTERTIAQRIFDFIEPFASYGFNRAHSTCYAIIAYQTAYLKANYPESFMAALLTSEQKNLDKVAIAISEAERMGIKVLAPDVNESFVEFGVVPDGRKNKIRYGLEAIKNVGTKVADNIVKEREKNGPYKSLEDWLVRLDNQTLNKKVIEALAKAGALDNLAERNQILAGMTDILKFVQSRKQDNAQADLFAGKVKIEHKKLELPQVERAPERQCLSWEKEFLGIYISSHPLNNFRQVLNRQKTKIGELNKKMAGKSVKVMGIITGCKKITTKNNQQMMFCQLEDFNSNTEVIVFPKILEQNPLIWRNDNIVALSGKITTKDGAVKLIANQVVEANNMEELNGFLGESFQKEPERLKLYIEKGTSKKTLLKIKQALEACPGDKPVVLYVSQNGGYQSKEARIRIKITPKLIDHLRDFLGKDKVRLEGSEPV
jgi:DNA polymerase-3 subunit alpha